MSLAENHILRYKIDEGADKLTKTSSFNFDDIEVRLIYAKAKFIVSLAVGILLSIIHVFMLLFSSKGWVSENHQKKSFILFLIIALLYLVKEKYQKKGQNSEVQETNNLGRGSYLFLVYLCFSVFMIYKLSALQMFLHMLFMSSYAYFFYEDFKSFIGVDDISTLSRQFNTNNLIYDFAKTCYENPDSRKIAIFFIINLIFMFVELVYGYISNSLGLITDSFHMLFDCTALFIGLCASYIAKMDVDKHYTYGYGRVETLSGLFNGIFLVFIAFNVFCESIERIYEPQRIETEGLLTVSTLGFIVNLIGLFFFHDNHEHHHGHDHSHENENMYGVFLHVLADTLGSLGVICSSILVKYYEIYIADPICSFIISLMILASSIPFIQMTANNLILKTPSSIKKKKVKALERIAAIEGVKECKELLIWEMAKSKTFAIIFLEKYVATVDLIVSSGANRSMIHDEVSTILRGMKVKDLTVQMFDPLTRIVEIEKKEVPQMLISNTEDDLGSKTNVQI